LEDVGLKFIENAGNFDGEYTKKLIKIALDAARPLQALRHEAIHALKDMGFFTPGQWKLLENQADKVWIDKYLKNRNVDGKALKEGEESRFDAYSKLYKGDMDAIREEAIADAFADFDAHGAPKGIMATLTAKLQDFFAKVKQAFKSGGYESAEDVFKQIETGKLTATAEKPTATAGAKPSLRQVTDLNAERASRKALDQEGESLFHDLQTLISQGRVTPEDMQNLKNSFAAADNKMRAAYELNKIIRSISRRPAPDIQQTPEQIQKISNAANDAVSQTGETQTKPSLRSNSYGLNVLTGNESAPDFGKKPVVDDIAKHFDKKVMEKFNRKLDYNDPEDIKIAMKMALEEVKHQMASDQSGLDWYDEDIKKAFADTMKVIPSLNSEPKRQLFSIMAGILSPNIIARDNWFIAAKAFEHYEKTGVIPGVNPETGGLWQGGTQSANKKKQMDFLNNMVKAMGEKDALNWLTSEHTVKEINDFRKRYGNITSGIDGKLSDIKPGLYAFGPKVGPFVSNINGIHDVTVDKWATRTFNRYFGTMTSPEGKIVDAPTEPQRRAIKALMNGVASDAGIKNYQVQSALWFYEQKHFRKFGTDSPSYGFSDGATKLLQQRGVGGGEAGVRAADETQAKPSLRTNTPEFKQWFGDSKIVTSRDKGMVSGEDVMNRLKIPESRQDFYWRKLSADERNKLMEDYRNRDGVGQPKVLYHGLAKDTASFARKTERGSPIFLTDNPKFAEGFSKDSFAWMAAHADDVLTPQQLEKARKQAIAEIRKDYRRSPTAMKEMVDSLKTGEYAKATGEAQDYLRKAYKDMLQSGPHIMPLYVRAEKPFDYENPADVKAVLDEMNKLTDSYGLPVGRSYGGIKVGNWELIESKPVQDVIKKLGYDSFYVQEGGNKNLAVYDSKQLKSATGNVGAYGERPVTEAEAKPLGMTAEEANKAQAEGDVRLSLRKSATEMFDPKEVDANSITKYKSREKLVNMNIDDFLKLAEYTNSEDSNSSQKMINARKRVADGTKFNSLPYLLVSGNSGTLQATGHEGRHRAKVLKEAGYETMPVVLKSDIRWSEQNNPENFDYKKNFPERIKAEKGAIDENFSIPFPFTREEAGNNYVQPESRKSLRRVESEIKSLTNGQAIYDAVRKRTTAREEQGYAERLIGGLGPTPFSYLRQKLLYQYNQLGVYGKRMVKEMGGAERLADVSAEAAALESDKAAGYVASALGTGNRMGGVPVYEKGYTKISNLNGTVKGVVEIFAPLAKSGAPEMYQAYQFWAMAKRGERLTKEGREKFTPDELAHAKELEKKYPEFVDIQKDWIKYNNGLVKYMIDTGVLSKEMGAEWMKYADYIPFYRQLEGERTIGPQIMQNLTGVKPPKKLKGPKGEESAPAADFLETITRNTQAAITSGLKNVAGQRAIDEAMFLGQAERVHNPQAAPNVLAILREGKVEHYVSADPLFIDAVKSLNLPELPFLSFLSKPADVLRSMVTKDPAFIIANMMKHSLYTYYTSGADISPITGTLKNFADVMANKSPEYQTLLNAGVIGGYEFSRNIEASSQYLAKDLRAKTGTQEGLEKAFTPITGIWKYLEHATEAHDAAVRISVYKDVLAKTGNEAEAIFRANEVLNFNRKGNSAMVRIVTAAIPFLNAKFQGLDLMYRGLVEPSMGGDVTARQKAVQKTGLIRAATLMGLSVMYAAMVTNDPDYEKQQQEVKDNNWIIPGLGVRIPIPFELGTLFKTMPEHIYRYFYGAEDLKELQAAGKKALMDLTFTPVPQVAMPVLEAEANYSFFTGRPIVGAHMTGIEPKFQVEPNTSIVAQKLGQMTNISPLKIDHIYQGYTGTMGMYLSDVVDSIFNTTSKPTNRFEQTPIIKRFLIDHEATGQVSQFYDLKNRVETAVRTINDLKSSGSPDLLEYAQEHGKEYAMRGQVQMVAKKLQELKKQALQIRTSDMDPDQKRDLLLENVRAQNATVGGIRQFKEALAE